MTEIYWPIPPENVIEWPGQRKGSVHQGTDWPVPIGTELLACFDGVAVFVGGDGATGELWPGSGIWAKGQAKTIDLQRADGLIARYSHLDGYNIRQGDTVTAGQLIGWSGDTGYSLGPHLHWELRWDRAWNGGPWIDPRTLDIKDLGDTIMTPQQEALLTQVANDLTWVKSRIGGKDSETTLSSRLAGIGDIVQWIKERLGGSTKGTNVTNQIRDLKPGIVE